MKIGTDKRIVILDYFNLMYRMAFAVVRSTPEDNDQFMLTKHSIMDLVLRTVESLGASRVIVAIDSKPSWRKEVFPDYKINRKSKSGLILADTFFGVMEEFIDDLSGFLSNFVYMSVPTAEADDIIAVLSKYTTGSDLTEEVVIVSTDSDMKQLISDRIKQYDPFKSVFVECLDPRTTKEIKVLSGDTSDDIPPIRRGCGPKTAEIIASMGLLPFMDDEKLMKKFIKDESIDLVRSSMLENYKRNLVLVDFEFIPLELQRAIIDLYNDYETQPIKNPLGFFMKTRMVKHMSEWPNRAGYYKRIS